MSTSPPAAADPALVELVRETLRRSDSPLKPPALKKALPKPYQKGFGPAVLEGLADAGHIVSYKKSGKVAGYGLRPLAELTRLAILAAATDEPQTWAALKKSPTIKDIGAFQAAKEVDAAREALVQAGRLFEWPKSGGKGGALKFGTRPADARAALEGSKEFRDIQDKLRKTLANLAKGLSRAGVRPADLERAAAALLAPMSGPEPSTPAAPAPAVDKPVPYEPSLAAVVLDIMIEEEPAAAGGAPVAIRNLRRALEFQLPGKLAFDDAIRALSAEGVLALHRHDFPGALTQAERDQLIPDGRGGYYIAVSRRS